jgi:plastocyanin
MALFESTAMLRARALLLVAAMVVVSFGACAGDDGDAASRSTTTAKAAAAATADHVTVKDFTFGPKSITVPAGTTVTWTNEDSFDHSIQIDSLSLAGPKFGPPAGTTTFTHQFATPGTYPYLCGVHNSMTGTVVVTS